LPSRRETFRNGFLLEAFYKAPCSSSTREMATRPILAALLLALLTLAAFAPLASRASPPQEGKQAALQALQAVLQGLQDLRQYLSSTNAGAQALQALDGAIANLRATIEIVNATGDARAAEATLAYESSRLAQLLGALGPGALGSERLQRALQLAQGRAAELSQQVGQLPSGPLRSSLLRLLQQANQSLAQASGQLQQGNVSGAAHALAQAKALLGLVNAALSRHLGQERLERYGPQARAALERALARLLERASKLKAQGLGAQALLLLERALELGKGAGRLLNSSDLQGAISALAQAEELLEEAEEHAGEARQALSSLTERAQELGDKLSELAARLASAQLPPERRALASSLLSNATAALNGALMALAQGRLKDASLLLDRASSLLAQLLQLLESGGRGSIGEARLEIRARLTPQQLRLEIENAGQEAATLIYIRLLDAAGAEVALTWSSSCLGTLAPGDRAKCAAQLQARPNQAYTLVVGAKPSSSPNVSEIRLPLLAQAAALGLLKLEGEIKGNLLELKLEAEHAAFTIEAIRVLTPSHQELQLSWVSPCPSSLAAGQSAECTATASFVAGQPYIVLVQARSEGGASMMLQLILLAQHED